MCSLSSQIGNFHRKPWALQPIARRHSQPPKTLATWLAWYEAPSTAAASHGPSFKGSAFIGTSFPVKSSAARLIWLPWNHGPRRRGPIDGSSWVLERTCPLGYSMAHAHAMQDHVLHHQAGHYMENTTTQNSFTTKLQTIDLGASVSATAIG